MDAPTKALIEVIGDSGVTVQLYAANGQHVIEAVNQRTGEAFVVRGGDLYTAVADLTDRPCEWAEFTVRHKTSWIRAACFGRIRG